MPVGTLMPSKGFWVTRENFWIFKSGFVGLICQLSDNLSYFLMFPLKPVGTGAHNCNLIIPVRILFSGRFIRRPLQIISFSSLPGTYRPAIPDLVWRLGICGDAPLVRLFVFTSCCLGVQIYILLSPGIVGMIKWRRIMWACGEKRLKIVVGTSQIKNNLGYLKMDFLFRGSTVVEGTLAASHIGGFLSYLDIW
jgi:hypothetical protein